jgi:alkanesulfonate monooxygenase
MIDANPATTGAGPGSSAKPLRFHWSMSSAGEKWRGAKARAAQSGIPDLSAHLEFCRSAEDCQIESLLTAVGFHRPDPIALAAALGVLTTRIKFMVACRSGLVSPTAYVQQVNTVSVLTQGRICLNIVGGHTPEEQRYYGDFLTHDDRYDRTDEFLTICRSFWSGSTEVNFQGKYFHIEKGKLNTPFLYGRGPEIYVGGASPKAIELAVKHASCFWTLPAGPDDLLPRIAEVLRAGVDVGLLVSLIARPTRAEAVTAAYAMVEALGTQPKNVHKEFSKRSDSVAFGSTLAMAEGKQDWLTNCLWSGAVPYLGAPSIALVGSFEEIAGALWDYRQAGITQFLFMGWPDIEEMLLFSRGVAPLIRALESRSAAQEACATKVSLATSPGR